VLATRLVRRLRERFEFVFACLDGLGTLGAELKREGFKVEVLGRRQGLDLRCVRRLAAFVRDQGVDLIHAHQYTPFFYCRAPGWIGHRPPVLFTEHGRFHPDLPSRKRMFFNRFFLRRTDRVVAVGQSVKQALIDNEGIPAKRIDVIYNGVRYGEFSNRSQAREAIRRDLQIDLAAPVAIQVARLDPIKDHLTALRAVQHVSRRMPDFLLLIVGDGPERASIEDAIGELKLAKNVRLLGQRSDVAQLLAAADVFLLTSLSEGIPVTLIEAMCAGLPVVTTAAGGVAEVVVHGQTGCVAKIGNAQELTSDLLRLLSDRELANRFGEQGLQRAQSMFSEAAMHGAYAAAYDEMIAANGRLSLSA
jgi:glycosyltransferase involved in cell wall biosynthesis